MWPYHPDLLATPVPRYTSFPTAAEFAEDISAVDLVNELRRASGDISLYLHIPFCESICWYCGCNTARTNRRERLSSYLEALHREIALVGQQLQAGAKINRIAFGGGSPNAIAPTDFVRLMLSLTGAFALADPDISIELDPRTFTPAWASTLSRVGITRASLGVQTFDPDLQAAIGRVQPTERIAECTQMLRGAGVTSLNYDLMYGLPGQTWDQLHATLDKAVAFGPDRIALFGYAHVPHLIARQRQIDASHLPDQMQRFEMAAHGYELLTRAGYVPIGFDHFALPHDPLAEAAREDRLHRNFQGFTDDAAPVLLGLGASAIGSLPGLLAQNEKNAGRYRMRLSQDQLPIVRGVRRSADDQARGRAIESLLCRGRATLPPPLAEAQFPRLEPFAARGLLRRDGETLIIEAEGLPYARGIAAALDPYRETTQRQFSSAV